MYSGVRSAAVLIFILCFFFFKSCVVFPILLCNSGRFLLKVSNFELFSCDWTKSAFAVGFCHWHMSHHSVLMLFLYEKFKVFPLLPHLCKWNCSFVISSNAWHVGWCKCGVVFVVTCHVYRNCVTPVVVSRDISTLFSVRGLQTASALASCWKSATISQFSSDL